jgi:hypothetical protein
MSEQNAGFGRRGLPPVREALRQPKPPSRGGSMSPLVKQIGGIAIGVAIVFALSASNRYFMKQAGKSLGRNFVEQATPGNPAATIDRVGGGDETLRHVHRICTGRADEAKLTPAQIRVTDEYMQMYGGENRLVHAAAYVACLATEQPKRFCQDTQRQHLAEAMRQYLKLRHQVREAWQYETRLPSVPVAGATGFRPGQLSPPNMPSSQVDPSLVQSLRTLAANGFISADDFGGFFGFGTPPEITEALKDVVAKQGACG